MKPALSVQEQYLFDYLIEEFSRYPDVRVRDVLEDNERGVSVKTHSREYFFPFYWSRGDGFKEVYKLVALIQDVLPSRYA